MMADPGTRGSPPPLATGEQLSADELLGVIRTQHESAARDLYVAPARILASWGGAWALGFGAFYVASPRARWHFLPLWAAAAILVALSAAAAAGVITQLARRGRGVQGPSHTAAARYGWSWLLGLRRGVRPEHRALPAWPPRLARPAALARERRGGRGRAVPGRRGLVRRSRPVRPGGLDAGRGSGQRAGRAGQRTSPCWRWPAGAASWPPPGSSWPAAAAPARGREPRPARGRGTRPPARSAGAGSGHPRAAPAAGGRHPGHAGRR